MKKNFLLHSRMAKRLYGKMKDLPIVDYHNHLSVAEIIENKRFFDIYDLWIKPDPYKHRAMRMAGVAEKYITGDANSVEKFEKWWETLPSISLHPLSQWSTMEFSALFPFRITFDGKNAKSIYKRCNDYLQNHETTVRTLLNLFGVEYACPCMSLTDDVTFFVGNERLAPSLRGDDVLAVSKECIEHLEKWQNKKIATLSDMENAVENRLGAFQKAGCRYADHALDNGFVFFKDDGNNEERFQKARQGNLTQEESKRLSSYMLITLGNLYAKYGMTMQLHIGAQRYTSDRLRAVAGSAGGFAAIGNSVDVQSLTAFLNDLEKGRYGLPKTVLFTLNPSDNALLSVLAGSYAKDGVAGLITQGPAWWWCDHLLGIVDTLEHAAVYGVLANFVGMTTDSRSFLSFVRHDYFRRILCNWLAEKWNKSEFLGDEKALIALTYQLCYGNVKKEK